MIYKNKADLVFTLLAEKTPVAPPSPGEAVPPSEEVVVPEEEEGFSTLLTLFVVLIIIVLLAFVILHFVRKRQQGGDEGKGIRFTPKDLGMVRESGEETFGGLRVPGRGQMPSGNQQHPREDKPFY